MPIVVKAKKDESTNDVIRNFKKAAAKSGIVDKAKARQFNIKPAQKRAVKKAVKRRLLKRARSLKKMKNISEAAIRRIYDKINE